MEIFELKYFLAVAHTENIHRASESIHVSPASLSKAVSRLEEELGTQLFLKTGRGIRLTPEGKQLQKKASQLVALEESIKFDLTGDASVNVYITCEEVLQITFGIQLACVINNIIPNANIQFMVRNEADAIQHVLNGEAHFAIITQEAPKDLPSKIIAGVEFKTVASRKHPLAKKKTIAVEEVLNHPFVVSESIFNGWRDDKFPRKIKYKASGLKMMEKLVTEGLALAYLPDYFAKDAGLVALTVTGCPYSCHQTIRIIAKDITTLGWMNRVWNDI